MSISSVSSPPAVQPPTKIINEPTQPTPPAVKKTTTATTLAPPNR